MTKDFHDLTGEIRTCIPDLIRILLRLRSDSRMIGADLAGYSGLSGSPDVRAVVNYLRRLGCPIASSRTGYWWAQSETEIAHTRADLQSRVRGILGAYQGLKYPRWGITSVEDALAGQPDPQEELSF